MPTAEVVGLTPFQALQQEGASRIKHDPLNVAAIVDELGHQFGQALDPQDHKKSRELAQATLDYEVVYLLPRQSILVIRSENTVEDEATRKRIITLVNEKITA